MWGQLQILMKKVHRTELHSYLNSINLILFPVRPEKVWWWSSNPGSSARSAPRGSTKCGCPWSSAWPSTPSASSASRAWWISTKMRTTSPVPIAGPSPRKSPSSNSGGSGSWTGPNHSCEKMAAKFEGRTQSWWTTRKSFTRSWWRRCRKMNGWSNCRTSPKKRRRKT